MGIPSPEVDTYLMNLPADRQDALMQVRRLIQETVPEAEEIIRYKMPAYIYDEHIVCAFASQKHYMSLYVDVELLAKYREELSGIKNLGKSCIRFRRIEALSLETVEKILRETMVRLRE